MGELAATVVRPAMEVSDAYRSKHEQEKDITREEMGRTGDEAIFVLAQGELKELRGRGGFPEDAADVVSVEDEELGEGLEYVADESESILEAEQSRECEQDAGLRG